MPGAPTPAGVAEVRSAVAALQASLSRGADAELHQESLEAAGALLRALDADFGPAAPGKKRVDAGAQAQRAAALSDRGAAAKSRSVPELPPGKHGGLEDHAAWKATAVTTQPSFSMRSKLVDPSAKEKRPEPASYTVKGPVTHRGTMGAPSWTIGAGSGRENGIPKPADQPGPGKYSLPSSLFENPTYKRDGQVKILSAKRRPLHEASMSDVAPHDYQTTSRGEETGRPVRNQAPAYTMRAKPDDPADRQKRPDPITYTVKDGVTHRGPVKGPSWTQSTADRSPGMAKPLDNLGRHGPTPGPGQYSMPTTMEGKHPLFSSCASAARTETKRCDPDDNPMLYPDRHY